MMTARQATLDFGDTDGVVRCRQENFEGRQQVITLIVQGSHLLSSGSSGLYFICHLGHQVPSGVVTLVVSQDSPDRHLGS